MRGQSVALVLRKYVPSVTDEGLSGAAGCRQEPREGLSVAAEPWWWLTRRMRQRSRRAARVYPKESSRQAGRPSSTKHGSATNRMAARRCNAALWNLRHPRGGGATDSCLRGEACRRHGPLGWSGDSLSAQARPGVALHSHAPLLPHPCAPQPGLRTCRHRQ